MLRLISSYLIDTTEMKSEASLMEGSDESTNFPKRCSEWIIIHLPLERLYSKHVARFATNIFLHVLTIMRYRCTLSQVHTWSVTDNVRRLGMELKSAYMRSDDALCSDQTYDNEINNKVLWRYLYYKRL